MAQWLVCQTAERLGGGAVGSISTVGVCQSTAIFQHLKSDCNVVKICGHLLIGLADFRRINMKYDSDLVLPVCLIRQKFYDYAYIS